MVIVMCSFFFFFNDTATTEIYTLSLHDALPILTDPAVREKAMASSALPAGPTDPVLLEEALAELERMVGLEPVKRQVKADRKSTRLNSSHANISYAVFCLKKKKNISF